MALAIREQILQFVENVLRAEAVQGGRLDFGANGISQVLRNYDAAVEVYPAILIYDGDQNPIIEDEDQVVHAHYQMGFEIEIHASADQHTELGPRVNEIYVEVMRILWEDRSMGGLCIDLDEEESQGKVTQRAAHGPTIRLPLSFLVHYVTVPGRPDLINRP